MHAFELSEQYLRQMIDDVKIMKHTKYPNTISCHNVLSRYTSVDSINPRKHIVYIRRGENESSNTKSLNNFFTYCDCKQGCRTFSPCSHAVACFRFFMLKQQHKGITILSPKGAQLSTYINDG